MMIPLNGQQGNRHDRELLGYGWAAVALHWASVVLVLIVGGLGLLRDEWPNKTAQSFWIDVHAVLGSVLWLMTGIRLAWRTQQPSSFPRDGNTNHARFVAGIVHGTLYALLLITPLIGLIAFFFHGRILDFGLFVIDPGISKDRTVFHPAQVLHGYLAYTIFVLAGAHALAALWHGLYLRDDVLKRMWPWALRGSTGAG